MRIPPAPSYAVVFLFGACWNALVEHSLWAMGFCLVAAGIAHLAHEVDSDHRR